MTVSTDLVLEGKDDGWLDVLVGGEPACGVLVGTLLGGRLGWFVMPLRATRPVAEGPFDTEMVEPLVEGRS